ncbi:MAG TPA: LLM class flavin-dependent oxidoreductase [Gaiellales bacterium]|nr:LLM class flavin-dependent oxidoreductase [Gaiellales bacterium]
MSALHDAAKAAASPVFGVPLSVLDVAPVTTDSSAPAALADATELAALVDRLGYLRLWYAEHHNMPGIASSAPEVLIANAAARTRRIRVGSGGVMLPNHSPLVVAERFGTLEALHPGRIDLGIGRAPGTDHRTMLALRRMAGNDDLLVLLHELHGFFNGFAPGEAYEGIHAFPGYGGSMPALWLLGSSGYSAQAAGLMGLPFAFAHHFSARNTLPALELYRSSFDASPGLDRPYAQVTAFCVCADTDEEANLLASAMALSFALRNTGRPPGPLPSLRQVQNHVWTDAERTFADDYLAPQVIGSPATVKARLEALLAETGADEVMAIASVPDAAARTRSFTLLAELAQLPAE